MVVSQMGSDLQRKNSRGMIIRQRSAFIYVMLCCVSQAPAAEQQGGMTFKDNLSRGRGFWSGSGGTLLGSGAQRLVQSLDRLLRCLPSLRRLLVSASLRTCRLLDEGSSLTHRSLVLDSPQTRRILVADSSLCGLQTDARFGKDWGALSVIEGVCGVGPVRRFSVGGLEGIG